MRNEGGQLWDSTTAWRLVEDLRIGDPGGDGPAGFAEVNALEIDRLGRFYVLEQQAQEIRVFDSLGAHVRTIGRKGKGPGEFNQAIGLGWDPHGRLWVVDQQNVRYTVLDTAGKLVATHVRPLSGWFTWGWQGGIDTAGRVYEWYRLPGATSGDAILRYDSTLAKPDTFPLPAYDGEVFKVEMKNMRSYAAVPFSPTLVWNLNAPAYVWFGITAPYRIYRRELTGDTTLVIERSYDPLPVSATERDSALKRYDWFVKQGGVLQASRVPGRKPAFAGFLVDDAGNLWVMPVVTGAEAGRAFDVFDPQGRYLGRTVAPFAPASGTPLFVRGDRLYAVTNDADGVPFVVRARIERSPPR